MRMAFSFAFFCGSAEDFTMQELSRRMLKSGWILNKDPDKPCWTYHSPLGLKGTLGTGWDGKIIPPECLLRELDRVEQAIVENRITRFTGTACRVQPPLPPEGSPLALRLANEHIAKGHAVLRLRATEDPSGDEALRKHGAWRVETLLPPWTVPANYHSAGFSVMTCEHLLDTLPQPDRQNLFKTLLSLTPPGDGSVYFTVVQMSAIPREWRENPLEDGYQVKYGHNLCFIKPYNESMLRRELSRALPGDIERAWILHHELTCIWRPHA
jgi:hypothetical protein